MQNLFSLKFLNKKTYFNLQKHIKTKKYIFFQIQANILFSLKQQTRCEGIVPECDAFCIPLSHARYILHFIKHKSPNKGMISN